MAENARSLTNTEEKHDLFYSAGGYLVIVGDLDFGSLVAGLAAYKDLAAPWKEVLNYAQRWTNFNSRFEFVVESFAGEDVLGPERVFGEAVEPLTGDLELSAIDGGPGTGGLHLSRLVVRPGQTVAGGASGAREGLLRMMAGLLDPAGGQVTIGGRSLSNATLPQIGATLAYVGPEPGMISRTIRDNLVYGLMRRAPDLTEQSTAEAVTLLREARRTGNITADPEGDWIDYAAAGAEKLDRRLLILVDRVGLADDLVSNALDGHIGPSDAERWTDPILAARQELAASFGAEELEDIAELWVAGIFNSNGSLLANVLFGLPTVPIEGARAFAQLPLVAEALDGSGRAGGDRPRHSPGICHPGRGGRGELDSFPGYPKAEILAAADLVHAYPGQSIEAMPAEHRETLRALALAFVQTRDRLDVVDDARIARLMACKARARELLSGREDFVFFVEDMFSAGRTIAENILNAKRRYDRKSAWKLLAERMEEAIRTAGLRDDLIRALLKRPRLLILDGIGGGSDSADVELRNMIRAELPDAAVIFASTGDIVEDVDIKVVIDFPRFGFKPSSSRRHRFSANAMSS